MLTYNFHRLYSKGRVLGHKRGKRNSSPNTSLLQIEGVSTPQEAQFYLGKVATSTDRRIMGLTLNQRVAYVYRAKKTIEGSKVRVIWGSVYSEQIKLSLTFTGSRVTRPHGNSGVVKSKFRSNLPPHSFGASVRIVNMHVPGI